MKVEGKKILRGSDIKVHGMGDWKVKKFKKRAAKAKDLAKSKGRARIKMFFPPVDGWKGSSRAGTAKEIQQ